MTETIPGPRALPIIGNLLDVQDEVPLHALERLADIYGPIFRLTVRGNDRVIATNFELFDELCNETRFYKLPPIILQNPDPKAAVGLFTAPSEKHEDWGQAHRILMPAFGPIAIQGMFDEMQDIASQLVLKWARKGSDYRIPVTSDFTRLTLDTIALCAMDYRFNSFYQDDLHPFVKAMTNVLSSRSNASQLSGLLKNLSPSYTAQIQKDILFQRDLSKQLVQYRRDHPTEKKDLLNAMIYGKDPRTGLTMRDELIAANMQTFLVAGHETTSGLLSFAFVNLLKNPATYFAAQKEVDEVVGKNKLEVKHLTELKYLSAVLRETLRLTPTAPLFMRGVRPENKETNPTIGGGKYAVPKIGVACLISKIHRDPKVWGEDALEFNPTRMLDENFEKLPKNAWKPFGTGMRACIGRAFAWQEALLVMALILQNFDLSLDDPNYEMKVVQTLTIKPKDFYIKASLRSGITATQLQEHLSGASGAASTAHKANGVKAEAVNGAPAHNMQILYGSNTGTCQALAQKLAAQATQLGYTPNVNEMDSAINKIPKSTLTVIITASYEGQPPDNAARFMAWLESCNSKSLEGVKFAVFGCGHSDWRSTFQRIPTLIDAKMEELGATRVVERGSSDVSKGDIFGDFDSWVENRLLSVLSEGRPVAQSDLSAIRSLPVLKMEMSTQGRASHLQHNVQWAKVIENKCLTAPGQPEKRHVAIQLPSNMAYSVGDYLAVLPTNPEDQVRRVIKKFDLPWDAMITITEGAATTLPVGVPISISDLLRGYVEIGQPATRNDIEILAQHASDPTEKQSLLDLTSTTTYTKTITTTRHSILDLLESHPSTHLPFPHFLSLLPSLKLRHYSISSSPLHTPSACTLTYSVLDSPSLSGLPVRFHGVASTYLQSLQAGDQIQVSVRSTNKLFRPPADLENTPMIMFCAGSGLAPFRGFVQERAVLIREGRRKLAPALLFVGCRGKEMDRLYGEEFEEWERIGAVDVRYAFSREKAGSEGCGYVQERILRDKEDVFMLWDAGAKVYVCGSKEVAQEIGVAGRRMVREGAEKKGKQFSDEELEAWFAEKKNERFVSDVFS